MAINTSKVAVGGIAGAVVNMVLGYAIFGMWLGPKMNAEMDAVFPGMSAKMMSGSNMVMNIVSSVVAAFVLAWLYAAMRPRFGPGMKTAVLAALPTWIAGLFFYYMFLGMGAMSMNSYLMGSVAALAINIAMAATAGMLYKEDGA